MENETRLVIRREYSVDRKTIFKALTDPESLEKWFFPTREEGWSVTVDFHPEEGSTYSLTMHNPEGEDYVHNGVIKEIEKNRKLVFTWNSQAVEDTLVTISLSDSSRGTKLTLTHEFMPEEEREGHREGWTELLEHLSERITPKQNRKETGDGRGS